MTLTSFIPLSDSILSAISLPLIPEVVLIALYFFTLFLSFELTIPQIIINPIIIIQIICIIF